MKPHRPKAQPSDKTNSSTLNRTLQSEKSDEIGARILEALGGRDRKWLANEAGVSPSTLHDYISGATPSADRAVAIADALGVELRWLVTGSGARSSGVADRSRPGEQDIPVRSFTDAAWLKGEAPASAVGVTRVPKTVLRSLDRTESLWMAPMPSNALPDVAREGDFVLCTDIDGPLRDGWACIFILKANASPAVRRVELTNSGLRLRAGDPDIPPIDYVEGGALRPIGRIVAAVVRALGDLQAPLVKAVPPASGVWES